MPPEAASTNPRSTVRIAGHPIHPMLVPLPIGFLVGAFLTDIAYLKSGWASYAHFSGWLIGAGIVTALIAAAVLPLGIWLSGIVAVLLLFNGWMGGELVFRGRVGVLEPEPEEGR